MYTLHCGDSLDVLKTYPDNHFDSIVTDPPYGFSFMGMKWDYDVPSIEIWQECLRVLKPGGYCIAFSSPRTYHRMTCRLEDAGFLIDGMIAWCFGQGFPKSMDISKALDRRLGAEREVVGTKAGQPGYSLAESKGALCYGAGRGGTGDPERECEITEPTSDIAKKWEGYGTALKPAYEPITIARKAGEPFVQLPERRFVYESKISTKDRASGLPEGVRNMHPTVKPTELMKKLVPMVTPDNGLVLDPFMGSGSTGRGAVSGGYRFVGVDLDPVHVEVSGYRIKAVNRGRLSF